MMKKLFLSLLCAASAILASAQSAQWYFSPDRQEGVQNQWLEGSVKSTDYDEALLEIEAGGAEGALPQTCMVGKKPGVTGLRTGDALVFTMPVQKLPEGTFVEFEMTLAASPESPRYFLLEYLDGGEWKPASDAKEEDGIFYSFQVFGAAPVEQYTSVIETFRLDKPADRVKVRARVVSDQSCSGGKIGEANSAVCLEPSSYTAAYVEVHDTEAPKDTTRVLCVGNSFTYVCNADWMLKRIAWSQGHYLDLESALKGGQTFGQHLGLDMTADAISKGGYDYVFLQNQSQTNAWYGQDKKNNKQLLSDAEQLVERVREYSPNAEIFIESTWSYTGKNNGGFSSQKEFDKYLQKGSKMMAKATDSKVSPIGKAFALCREERPDIEIYGTDEKHQSAYGSYLKACVNYRLIFGEDFEGEVADCHLDPETTTYLRNVAERTVKCQGNDFGEKNYANRAEFIAAQIHDPDSKYVVVACHRGDWRNFPENSICAIESVIKMGADIMELDLKMTKDSVLVLSHDADVLRCTNFKKVFKDEPGKSPKVSDLTYAEIQKLSLMRAHNVAIDTMKMPTLEQALRCCKDRICVNVDQGYEYYDQVLEISERLGVTDQLLIKGKRSIEDVAAFESKHEHNMMYMPVVDIQKKKGIALFNSYMEQNVVPLAYELCWQSNDDGAFDEACRKVIAQGSKVWVNTIWASLCGGDGNDDDAAFLAEDKDSVYGQYLEKGVSMIQTDRPEQLIEYLKARGRH